MTPGSSSKQTTTQTNEPWSGSQPYLKEVMGEAQRLYQSNIPQYYGGSTVSGFTPEQEAAQRGTIARASSGAPVNAAASQWAQGVLGGGESPYATAVAREVVPRVNAQFSQAGRYGSGAHTGALTDALVAGIAPYQLAAAQMAPQIAGQDYLDLQALGSVGAERQELNQALTNADIARFNFEQQKPFSKLTDYLSYIQGGGSGFGTTTTTSPYQGASPFQQALAGLLGAGSLATPFLLA